MPLLGVLFWNWNVGDIMILFWAESAIIGLFALVKLAIAARWAALFLVPFFMVHFGIFMSVHFVFLYVFFIGMGLEPAASLVEPLFTTLGRIWFGLGALLLSHAVSFVFYVIGREERLSVNRVMTAPYTRIIVMQITIIVGAVPTLALGQPVYALVLLVILKVAADVISHVRAHPTKPKSPLT